jgi:hypothetical protein
MATRPLSVRSLMTHDTIGAARPVRGPSSAGSAVRGDSRVPRVQETASVSEADGAIVIAGACVAP